MKSTGQDSGAHFKPGIPGRHRGWGVALINACLMPTAPLPARPPWSPHDAVDAASLWELTALRCEQNFSPLAGSGSFHGNSSYSDQTLSGKSKEVSRILDCFSCSSSMSLRTPRAWWRGQEESQFSGAAIEDHSMEELQKVKTRSNIRSCNPILGIYPKEAKTQIQ